MSRRTPRTRSGEAVLVDRDPSLPGVLSLTLHRPAVLNAYDRAMRDALFEGLELARDDPSVQVVVLRGAGRAFSSGGDLTEFGTAPSPIRARDVRAQRDLWSLLATLPAVTVASVHGLAAGGGLEMALLCDLLLCARDAKLSLPETGLGAIPGVGGTQTLPRAVGEGRAASLLLLGETIDGVEAERIGLAARAVPRARLEVTTRRWAKRISALPSEVALRMVEALRRGRDVPLEAALALEKRLAHRLPDHTS